MENKTQENTNKPPQWLTGADDSASDNFVDGPEAFQWQKDGKSSGRPIMILLFCAIGGMIGLYMFGSRQKPADPSDEQVQTEARIDVAIAKLTGNTHTAVNADTIDRLVQNFYDYPNNQQVGLEDLRTNPFAWQQQKLVQISQQQQEEIELVNAKNARMKELSTALDTLKLQSIVISENNSRCLINNNLYGTGQTVGVFLIESIVANEVLLVADDMEFLLKL